MVIDASMTIAWILQDEHSVVADVVLQRVVEHGATVPSIWWLEVANVLRNAVRRRRCDEAHVDRSLDRLAHLAIATDPETSRAAWTATLALAREHGLTLYDAAYLELAIRLGCPLASFDTDLIIAARKRGVETFG